MVIRFLPITTLFQIQMTTIKDITIPVLNKPPHFEAKYNENSVDYYVNKLMKPQAIAHLLSMVSNYDNIDFHLLKVNEIQNHEVRLMVKQDLLNVLNDSILETFYSSPTLEEVMDPSYNLTIEEENERYVEDGPYDDNAKKRLEKKMCEKLNILVFKRTANTCTAWGFI